MSQGLDLPLGADQGRARLARGEDQLKKIITLALSDGDSENPFQDLGIGNGNVFDVNDQDLQARLRQRIVAVFRRFSTERRAALAPGSPTFRRGGADGEELIASIKYVNMETTDSDELEIPLGQRS